MTVANGFSLKLLFYAYDWSPLVGGVQTVTRDLAEGICASSDANGNQAIGVTLITQTPAGSMDDSALPFRVVRRPRFTALLAEIWSADVIHLASPAFLPLLIAWFLRKSTVVLHHGYQSICPNGLLLFGPEHRFCPGHFMAGDYGKCVACCYRSMGRMRGLKEFLLTFPRRWLCARASANISITDHVAQRISLPRVQTIYHGVPDSGFDKSVKRATSEDILQIGYVGRFVDEKGLPILLQAARKLKENCVSFHLKLIGDGDARERLENEVDRLGIREHVTFTGYMTGVALDIALQKIQVIVMTSQTEESAGLASGRNMGDARRYRGRCRYWRP